MGFDVNKYEEMKTSMKSSVVLLGLPMCLLLLGFLFSCVRLVITRGSSVPVSEVGRYRDGCNYSSGEWVLDTSREVFYSADCPFHRNAWNCEKNKRPGVERMSQWSWVPSKCSSWARVDPHFFLRAMRGMRVGFVGDSLNENFMVSLLCILSAADGKARKWKRRGAWRGAYFPSFDVTVGYHRAVLLSRFANISR
ncbi:hypothetical protein KC19_5G123500 [Ceratodon purpureus]|uniref:Trichome birefringence-like N-terminal domain-containing protein n=1 Tax=Ceratodon purpureus TaxID=3225 RepID=A0A8T0I0K9_CERPU|nr:hypothetical protein KC19_5G123500 [Ceratodon purpureus]